MMHVTSLHCYPIKGCRGHNLQVATIDALGVAGDRRLMLVDDDDRFLSQREEPMLATVEPERDGERLAVRAAGAIFEHELRDDLPRRKVTIWGEPVSAVDQGDAAASWFTTTLRRSCRLVMFDAQSHRMVDPKFSPRADAETAFTDGYPLLGVLEESLADLNTRLAEPIPMARFRPSIGMAGALPWSEDTWKALVIGNLEVDVVKPCARCVVTTTDQQTGARNPHQEPLRTLSQFRLQRPFGAIFGQNMVPRATGTIAVGDAVTAT